MTQENQTSQSADQKKNNPGPKKRKSYTTCLEELCASKELVEVIAHDRRNYGTYH